MCSHRPLFISLDETTEPALIFNKNKKAEGKEPPAFLYQKQVLFRS